MENYEKGINRIHVILQEYKLAGYESAKRLLDASDSIYEEIDTLDGQICQINTHAFYDDVNTSTIRVFIAPYAPYSAKKWWQRVTVSIRLYIAKISLLRLTVRL